MTNLAFYRPAKIESVAVANSICGGLSYPSKMPCPAYSLPAKDCITGSELRKVKGSTCASCYACKGRYGFSNVQAAMQRRLDSLNHPQWIDALCYLITDSQNFHFRWHDSGDLQSIAHFANIVEIANRLPKVKFWLPTRERKLVLDYQRLFGAIPKNLVVRVSAAMVDGAPPESCANTSTVHRREKPAGRACPAPQQNNQCGTCRACWNPRVKNVSYSFH
jgi:hypothetical protein